VKLRSFQLKLLLVLVGTVALLTGLTLLIVTNTIRYQIIRKTAADVLAADRTFQRQQALRFLKLDDICSRLAGSRRLAAALEEGDPEVLSGVAQNEQEISKLSHTLLVIADKSGKTLVPAGDTAAEKLVASAILNQSDWRTGFFVRGDQLFEGVCRPLRTGNERLGYVVVAFPLGDSTATKLAQALGSDSMPGNTPLVHVGFLVNERIVASTLRRPSRGRVESVLRQRPEGEFVDVEIDDTPYVAFASQAGWGVARVLLFSQEPLRDLLAELRFTAILIGAVAMVICLGVTTRLAKGIARPVAELENGARQIRQGNLAVRVEPRTSDEIGRLAEAFNEMAEGLQLKEKYRGVLDKVVSPEVAEELLRGKIDLGGQLRTVTVLFCDIRGFTRLTEGMAPHDVLDLLNRHMTAMTEIVRQHGGIVDKFAGDEIMAVFGAPKPGPNDALAAIRAAQAMMAARQRLNAAAPHERQLDIGIGINTGEAVAGNMGSDKQLSYTVLGKTVNLASRLCKSARPGQVLASASTMRAAGTGVTASSLEAIAVKGFSDAIDVFEIR